MTDLLERLENLETFVTTDNMVRMDMLCERYTMESHELQQDMGILTADWGAFAEDTHAYMLANGHTYYEMPKDITKSIAGYEIKTNRMLTNKELSDKIEKYEINLIMEWGI